jgi:hypothetical protein
VVPRSSDRISRVPPYLICPLELRIRGCHPYRWPFQTILLTLQGSAGPRSLATTCGVSLDFLSSGYLDVSVPRVCSYSPMYSGISTCFTPLCISCDKHNRMSGGFPHSDIHGSKPIPGSPWLNAGYHVLHRLLLPRHPPNALFALDLIQKEQGSSRLAPSWKVPYQKHVLSHPSGSFGTASG